MASLNEGKLWSWLCQQRSFGFCFANTMVNIPQASLAENRFRPAKKNGGGSTRAGALGSTSSACMSRPTVYTVSGRRMAAKCANAIIAPRKFSIKRPKSAIRLRGRAGGPHPRSRPPLPLHTWAQTPRLGPKSGMGAAQMRHRASSLPTPGTPSCTIVTAVHSDGCLRCQAGCAAGPPHQQAGVRQEQLRSRQQRQQPALEARFEARPTKQTRGARLSTSASTEKAMRPRSCPADHAAES